MRQQIRELDPDLPVYNVRTMEQRVDESLARRRFAVTLLTLFALLALGLAAIGTYGVIAYLVSQGTREIGIRLALGATPGNVVGMVVRAGMLVVAAGIVTGLAGALVLTRFMQALLFNVTPTDAVTFAVDRGAARRDRVWRHLCARAPRGANRSAERAALRIGHS